ncbi:hypothetical protein, partial [Holdemania filiformis]
RCQVPWFPSMGTFFCFCAGVKGRSFAFRVGFEYRSSYGETAILMMIFEHGFSCNPYSKNKIIVVLITGLVFFLRRFKSVL